ncbi:EthD domain-containing protein [Aquabacterium sp. J223]|uniref:EthD domain-containing protein n=1 Tax=Aquabacterium sp. J223 TaxID=2898431 RepID=UPI0021AE267D|nr:EthD domain-containing protein [Aquabacterium sp. J223]UUX95119.1 EthD domain-containing protein [Aquabacterium sp. J223]
MLGLPSVAEPPLKLIILGRRRPGQTRGEHRHHIRRVHGELVLRYIAEDPSHAPRRYVQNVVLDGEFPAVAAGADPFALDRDFVTQISFDELAGLPRSRDTAFYRERLQGDEDHFVDQATVLPVPSSWRECRRSDGERPTHKVFVFSRRRAGVEREAFLQAWRDGAAALHAAVPGLRRHVQNEPLARPGHPPPVDAIDELWLDDEAAAQAALAAVRGWLQRTLVQAGLADDTDRLLLIAQEQVLHAGRA